MQLHYLLSIYKEANVGPPKPRREQRPSPPPDYVHCDGALLLGDNGGLAQIGRCGKIMASFTIFVEAWALQKTCGVAVDMGLSDAIFELDCN